MRYVRVHPLPCTTLQHHSVIEGLDCSLEAPKQKHLCSVFYTGLHESKRPGVRTPDRINVVELEGFEPSTFSMPLRRAPNCAIAPKRSGGPGGIRTPDLRIANAALSQLSYRPSREQRAEYSTQAGACQTYSEQLVGRALPWRRVIKAGQTVTIALRQRSIAHQRSAGA